MDLKYKIKKFFSLRMIIGLVLGSIGGYMFYFFIGCSSGTCAISSNPWISTFYGMFAGGLLFYTGKEIKNVEKDSHIEENISEHLK